MAYGLGRPVLNLDNIRDVPIRLAPLQQQNRIVAEIEKQFSRLDEAVANLKRVKANLKRYKAAVLKAAVEGKLTEEWRKAHPDVEPASELLKRILADRRKSQNGPLDLNRFPQLPAHWCWARIEDLGDVQLGRQRAPKYHSGQYMRPYLRVQNVFEDRIDLEDVMEMDFPPSDFQKFQLKPGDILLNEGQSPELLGRPAIYRDELPGACFTNTLIRFRPYLPMSSEYPLLVFRAYMRTGRFTKEGTITTNIAHLSAGRFAKIEFPLPPVEEQKQIVNEADRQLSAIDVLYEEINKHFLRADRFRQSILRRAFGGR
jgi:type I restriction enzyme S subunit